MDNEIQFVETSNAEIANLLFPDINATSLFLGLVKSEPEKYSEYGRFFIIRHVTPLQCSSITILS